MNRFDTPDVIVGLGGVGSKVVYEFIDQDWIIESATGTGKFEGEKHQKLEAYTIDSAVDDSFHNKVDGLKENVAEARHQNTVENESVIDVSIENFQITEQFPSEWRRTSVLTSQEDVTELLEERNLNAWWLREGREPLNKMQDQGFSGGVYRRRAISKALFHISEFAGEGVTPPSNTDDEVVMVTALGGGTGSGTFIDIAAEMEADHIDLFAFLPTEGEKLKEKTNAFATLSELEYLELNGESPFRTITLFPYLGGTGNGDRATNAETLTAAVRTIVAHHQAMRGYNIRDMLNTASRNGPPSYSSFALAVPKTVEYDIGKRDRAKTNLREVLDNRIVDLDAELNLCKLIDDFLHAEFQIPGNINTPESDSYQTQLQELRDRIDRLFEDDLQQKELAVAGLTDERDRLLNQYRNSTPDGSSVREWIDDVSNTLSELVTLSNYGPDGSLERKLAKLVVHELKVVERRRELLDKIYHLPKLADMTGLSVGVLRAIRDALVDVVLDDEKQQILNHEGFREVQRELENQKDRLEQEHSQYTALLEILEEELEARVATARRGASPQVKTVAEIQSRFDERGNELARVKRFKEAVRDRFNNAVEVGVPDGTDVEIAFDDLGDLNDDLQAIGVDPIDGQKIEDGLETVRKAKEERLRHGNGIIFTKDRSEKFNEAIAEIDEDYEVFTLQNDGRPDVDDDLPLSQEIQLEVERLSRWDSVEDRRSTAIENVVEEVHDCLHDYGELYEPDIESIVREETGTPPVIELVDLPAGDFPDPTQVVENKLRDPSTGDPDQLLSSLFDFSRDGDSVPLWDALNVHYISPVETRIKKIESELENLQDNGPEESDGIIKTCERLLTLSGRYDPQNPDSNLPSVTPPGEDEVYGADFAEDYSSDFDIDIGLDSSVFRKEHPYVRDERAEMDDLGGGPDDIGESDVIENHEESIFGHLAQSAQDMFEGRYDRAPVVDFDPEGAGDDHSALYQGLRFVNLYCSRGLEEVENLSPEEGTLHPKVTEKFRNNTQFNRNSYGEAQYSIGGPDEVTMVTLIGGLTMENVSRVVGDDGYASTYEQTQQDAAFLTTHHAVGIGGQWELWEQLREWTNDDGIHDWTDVDDPSYGAYVYRDTVRQMDKEFVADLNAGDEAQTEAMLNDYLTAETFDGNPWGED